MVCSRALLGYREHDTQAPLGKQGGTFRQGCADGEVDSPYTISANLARGPAKCAASEKMQMQMKDGLPSAFTVVQYCAVAGEKIQFARQLRGDELQLAEHRLVFRTGLVQR